MQRITRLAACRELGGLVACSPGVCAWKRGPTCSKQPAVHRQWAGVCVRPARPFTGQLGAQGRRLCVRRSVFAAQKHRLFSSQPGADGPPGSSGGQPAISVVGIPDPITWIRCKVIMYLIELYFELDINSVEFNRGTKQVTTDRSTHRPSINCCCISNKVLLTFLHVWLIQVVIVIIQMQMKHERRHGHKGSHRGQT